MLHWRCTPQTSTFQGVLAVISVLTFVAGFAVGLGATVWTIMSEVLPTRVRSKVRAVLGHVSTPMLLFVLNNGATMCGVCAGHRASRCSLDCRGC